MVATPIGAVTPIIQQSTMRPPGVDGANGVGRAYTPPGTDGVGQTGFADALARGLQAVSDLEGSSDAVAQSLATGGGASVEDLMVATTQAQLGVELLAQVRDRALEAYQEIMRMPV